MDKPKHYDDPSAISGACVLAALPVILEALELDTTGAENVVSLKIEPGSIEIERIRYDGKGKPGHVTHRMYVRGNGD